MISRVCAGGWRRLAARSMDDSLTAIFFSGALSEEEAKKTAAESLAGADDGELFMENSQTQSFLLEDGITRRAEFQGVSGFGLRGVQGEASFFAHSDTMTPASLKRAGEAVRSAVKNAGAPAQVSLDEAPVWRNEALYPPLNPVESMPVGDKLAALQAMDSYVRGRDSRIANVNISFGAHWQAVCIIRPDGAMVRDIRPLVRLHIQATAHTGTRREMGMGGTGGRDGAHAFLTGDKWREAADEAVRQALVNLESRAAPAGEMDVVLGPGWPGILLHEAIGHGLEGDFHRKKSSAFTGLMGQRIAAAGVTVIDDALLPMRRGSLAVDDEGVTGERTVLIEDGIMTSCLQDRLNARLMGQRSTGNGRRESYRHLPFPRMTNTFMLAGRHDPAEIIASVKKGIYAPSFGGGQVDITNGKFVFSCTEAYEIENGKLGRPLKGAMLTGSGPDVLRRVSMIGNDMAMDPGMGTCGKEGQSVPVGVGQPTLLINGLTVGGTQVAA